MIFHIQKSLAEGKVIAPPSKSYAHRLLIAGSLANDFCMVDNIAYSQDILATISCLTALGFKLECDDKKVLISPKEKIDSFFPIILDCRESGSTLRFMIPIALAFGTDFIFKGSERLFLRGLSVYEKIFDEQGISYVYDTNQIHVKGKLKGGIFKVDGSISSQFISGLLFSLPILEEDSVIEVVGKIESSSYIDMTLEVLQTCGINIIKEDNKYIIKGKQKYIAKYLKVEGDYSNAAFLDAFNYIGGNVQVAGLNEQSLQGDKKYKEYFELLKKGYSEIDISNTIDLGPILFTLASYLNGAKFIGTRRLAIKESDRVKDMLEELKKFDANFSVGENEVEIYKSDLKATKDILEGHNDHRIVMSLCVLLTKFGGNINGVEAVKKSFPNFFEVLKSIGISVENEINER